MYFQASIEQLIHAQSLCFAVSWLLAYTFGSRVRHGHWLSSLLFLAVLETLAYFYVTRLHGPPPAFPWWGGLALIALITIARSEQWNAIGQACMASTVSLSLVFLAYVVTLTMRAHLGPLSLFFSLVLLVLQTFALLLLCAGSFEIIDVLCRIRWRRRADPQPTEDFFPRVSLHVPAYNEPSEMVIETLDALARLDYPNYEVIVIDDNTTDESLWRPLETHCRKLGFKFFHLENWPGFKSGALNFAITKTDPDAQIIGVVDSDYIVKPDYLRRCVGFFREPSVAFVQTPQDYRDIVSNDRYAKACYDAYLYFFKISMASRNEHNGIIFAGTMGLIRKEILERVGGWDEWCITEDAEISLRILDRGYEGIYVDQSFGQGLMPLNFEGLKKQRFRWAFGGMQILRRHAEALMPWARWLNPGHRLTFAQKWDYLMGGLQWLNDPITFAFTALLLIGTTALLVAQSLFIQPLAPAVMIVPFLFIFVGVSRFLWALRLRIGMSLGRAVSAFVILLSLTWVVTMACVLGLVKREGVFLRTPKRRAGADPWHALRIVSNETMLFALCAVSSVALLLSLPRSPHVWLMAGLLGWQSVIYASAPMSSLWGYKSEMLVRRSEYLRSSRTTGQRFSSMIADRRITWSLTGLVLLGFFVYYLAVSFAPEQERMFRANPENAPFIPAAAMQTSLETQVRATLYLEREAALKGSVEDAVRLWDPNGTIRDAHYTVTDPSDDTVWKGIDEVRRRYTEEFARHKYLSLFHSIASVMMEGDSAIVVNDLHAVLRTPSGVQRVYLSRGDRWILVRGEKGWRIRELVLNRSLR